MPKSQDLAREIQNGFANVAITGSLREDLEQWRETWLQFECAVANTETRVDLEVQKSPILMCSNKVKQAYAHAKYDDIKTLENQMKNDLDSIDDTIRSKGIDAFQKVEQAEKTYYIAQSQTGSVWIYGYQTREKVIINYKGETETTFISYYQVGKYSRNGQVAGTVDYIIKTGAAIAGVLLASLVGKMVQTILIQGTKLVLRCLVSQLVAFSAENGLRLAIRVVDGTISAFVGAITFMLTFVGLDLLRKYTVKLQIFNWSTEHELHVSECYCYNTKMICEEHDNPNSCLVSIPKMIAVGSEVKPPGFDPPTSMDAVCHYITYFFENQATFLQEFGTGMKIEIDRQGSNKGFMYGFHCSHLKDIRQKAEDDMDCAGVKFFYETAPWNSNPREFHIETEHVPVIVTLNAVSGADDSVFHPIVNFNSQ